MNYRFTGKELDPETGLYHFPARYYDPMLSLWLSSDPAMDGSNWYGYCSNNPLKYVDPTGLIPKDALDGIQAQQHRNEDQYAKKYGAAVVDSSHKTPITDVSQRRAQNAETGKQRVDAARTPAPTDERRVPESKYRGERVTQLMLRPDEPSGPCYFLAIVGGVQDKAGENLTLFEMLDMALELHNSGAIGNKSEFYYVWRPNSVMQAAAKRLGYSNAKFTYPPESATLDLSADYQIRRLFSVGASNGPHYQLGNSNGGLLWEPYGSTLSNSTGKADLYRALSIDLGQKDNP